MQHQTTQPSLLARIGGAEAVDTLVGALYFNILNDPRLAHFFRHVSVDRVVAHQRQFLLAALAGDAAPEGMIVSLATAHARLIEAEGLGHRHFDALIENLDQTLRDLEVPEYEACEVVAVLAATRSQIFGE